MKNKRICPNCRSEVPADAPEGVCPSCALRAGFAPDSIADSPTEAHSYDPAPPVPPEELDRLLPELETFELVGRGGMGAVYKARHRTLDRWVAVKVLDSALRNDPSFADRFTREARTLAKLDHPNVVRVHDFGCRENLYYLIMEFVDGVNLRQTIQAGAVRPEEALAMVPQVCDALQYAHDQGVVHRDIKPENILVDKHGGIKIADFGLAKLVRTEGRDRLTHTRQIMGTPHYMAPEQIENPSQVDHRADIFALGVVFYELLTGELPVGRFPVPSRKVEIDVRFDEVVLRTLEKEPGLRYQQASELKHDVRTVMTSPADPIASSAGASPAISATGTAPAQNLEPYEYRSKATFLGLPLIHIHYSRGKMGQRTSLACGWIAVGDLAVGGIAMGGFTAGGIALGGFSAGIIGIGGMTLGLFTALGGLAVGSIPVGGLSIGFLPFGGIAISPLGPETGGTMASVATVAISSTVAATAALFARIYAWFHSTHVEKQ